MAAHGSPSALRVTTYDHAVERGGFRVRRAEGGWETRASGWIGFLVYAAMVLCCAAFVVLSLAQLV